MYSMLAVKRHILNVLLACCALIDLFVRGRPQKEGLFRGAARRCQIHLITTDSTDVWQELLAWKSVAAIILIKAWQEPIFVSNEGMAKPYEDAWL